QAVDFVIRVGGYLNVGADTKYRSNEKPDLQTLLGIVLDELGPKTREKVVAALLKRARSDKKADQVPDEVSLGVGKLIGQLTIAGEATRAGAVSGHIAGSMVAPMSAGRKKAC
ncbi:MAG TPA: hypothetical protein VG433_04105, partial [Pirellulales bacterium]|nr:hypothetical protein [Pirellulales bacterium]